MKLNENGIGQFLHCKQCIQEVTTGKVGNSPRDYARLSVGWTKQGLQVWCNRHDCNVIHVDFEGMKHHADLTRQPLDYEEKMK